jgi:hypothetical protein
MSAGNGAGDPTPVELIQPVPTATSWTPGIAEFPTSPGVVTKLVVIDVWSPLGLARYFLEPAAAASVAAQIAQAAKDAQAGGFTVVEGAAAAALNRAARRHPHPGRN